MKPQVLLPFRTGAAPVRSLLKSCAPLESSQVAMGMPSQFPAARECLHCPNTKTLSNGWAQGIIFSFSKDEPLCFADEADDWCITSFSAVPLEIILCAHGPLSDWAAQDWTIGMHPATGSRNKAMRTTWFRTAKVTRFQMTHAAISARLDSGARPTCWGSMRC